MFVNKNEQTSIAKEDIDRVDTRPSGKRPVTKETKETMSDTNAMANAPNRLHRCQPRLQGKAQGRASAASVTMAQILTLAATAPRHPVQLSGGGGPEL